MIETTGKIGSLVTVDMNDPRSAYMADHPASHVSSRYEFMPTNRIVNELRDYGFYVRDYKQARMRKQTTSSTAKHILWLRRINERPVGDVYPEVLMINAHNGRFRLKFLIGFLRLICANGLVAGNIIDGWKGVTHMDYNPFEKIIERVHDVATQATHKLDVIHAMQDRYMNLDEAYTFATQAAGLTPERVYQNPTQLLTVQREEDKGNDLWRVFNKVQENLIKGGTQIIARNGRRRAARGITSVDKNLELNQKLWKLAESYLPTANESEYALAA